MKNRKRKITPVSDVVNPNCPPGCEATVGPQFPAPGAQTPAEIAASLYGQNTSATSGFANIQTAIAAAASGSFQLSSSNDSGIIDAYATEALNIAGANINVYKMLGIYEQCKLVDATGLGSAISGGSGTGYPATNAFDMYATEWRSIQTGNAILASAFIGYDFGEIKTLDQSRVMYGIDTSIHKHITAFAIKQSPNQLNRVTQVRLEYSQDGRKWYGAGLATLPDDDCLNTVLMKRSAPARYWRLRPLKFNGGTANPCAPVSTITSDNTRITSDNTNLTIQTLAPTSQPDYWGVQALELFHNYMATEVQNIQDPILFENRDRNYATEAILLKGSYDIQEPLTELTFFGSQMPTLTYSILISFGSMVTILGRPIVVGDIIQLPSETQYDPYMNPVLRWLEVTDVTWSAQGYSPTWQPLLVKISAAPAFASQETQDIFGNLAEEPVTDGLGLMDKGNGRNPNYQDFSNITTTIRTTAEDEVPEQGREGSGLITQYSDDQITSGIEQGINLAKIGLNPKAPYTEDAMPPNNAPYTTGVALPTNPTDGDYFRLTYIGSARDIPAQLYRYSQMKGRWVYLETDKRALHNPIKPLLTEYLTASQRRKNPAILQRDVPYCEPEK